MLETGNQKNKQAILFFSWACPVATHCHFSRRA
jgi:hypothetical protein